VSRSLLVRTLLALALASSLAGCGDDSSHARTARHAATKTTTTAAPEPTKVPDAVAPGELAPIVITSPAPFTTLVGTLPLAGTATTHEGTLAWAILGADLKPLVQGHMQATCGAPCRGRFSARISLAKVPLGSWELHVWTPNTSDTGAARLHDTLVPITVSDRIVPGAPAPGATPPGGPPQ
jgi:hypothetical protein